MTASRSNRTWLRVVALTALTVLAAACGDTGLLDGVGTRSQDAVLGDLATTSTIPIRVDEQRTLGVVISADLTWWNDGIEDEANGEKNYVVAKVWERAPHQRSHQASRREILQVLPNLAFHGVVPKVVRFETTQLIYDTASATIDVQSSVAFGLWPVEPYTVQDASVAVLRVGEAGEFRIDGIVSDIVDDGLSLSWTAGLYRYELFCRIGVNDELCWQMAESTVSLASQIAPST